MRRDEHTKRRSGGTTLPSPSAGFAARPARLTAPVAISVARANAGACDACHTNWQRRSERKRRRPAVFQVASIERASLIGRIDSPQRHGGTEVHGGNNNFLLAPCTSVPPCLCGESDVRRGLRWPPEAGSGTGVQRVQEARDGA